MSPETTTKDGAFMNYERLVAARCAGLRELLAGWQPDQQPELQAMVDKLGRDLVNEIPTPPAVPIAGGA
jgi:hypothetical protein